jgi:hypothetical protein
MKRVTGIGGIFFKARDPAALRAWYKTHLGIDVQEWGGAAFTLDRRRRQSDQGKHDLVRQRYRWKLLRAEHLDLHGQLPCSGPGGLCSRSCAKRAAMFLEKTDDSEYEKFGWVMDPEGNKVELWQPPAGQ